MLHGDSLSASDDLSSADNLFKQFGIRLGLQHDWPDLDLNCSTLMSFMKKQIILVIYEKNKSF